MLYTLADAVIAACNARMVPEKLPNGNWNAGPKKVLSPSPAEAIESHRPISRGQPSQLAGDAENANDVTAYLSQVELWLEIAQRQSTNSVQSSNHQHAEPERKGRVIAAALHAPQTPRSNRCPSPLLADVMLKALLVAQKRLAAEWPAAVQAQFAERFHLVTGLAEAVAKSTPRCSPECARLLGGFLSYGAAIAYSFWGRPDCPDRVAIVVPSWGRDNFGFSHAAVAALIAQRSAKSAAWPAVLVAVFGDLAVKLSPDNERLSRCLFISELLTAISLTEKTGDDVGDLATFLQREFDLSAYEWGRLHNDLANLLLQGEFTTTLGGYPSTRARLSRLFRPKRDRLIPGRFSRDCGRLRKEASGSVCRRQ